MRLDTLEIGKDAVVASVASVLSGICPCCTDYKDYRVWIDGEGMSVQFS